MVIPILASTFITVFLAELGDKTQLATVAISGSSNKPIAVFLGSSSALVIASLIGALAGGSIANLIPEVILKLIAALGFLVIGIRFLWPTISKSDLASFFMQTRKEP
ncbi:TMEM165/GDT1 family protein [Prochlorococcus sp. MIT 1341]|uniref:TMEM165/GDT1 family protein n=1 Tax=Prochlorococcus sp. MIT 1341 TaxID=3096221 RepID=UPI002A75FC99|nr:TMEM165/GDT1 family protein [Prochlorococcus sp. MIT 1341]